MSGRVFSVFLACCLVACAGAQTEDDGQWGDTGGKEDTVAYEKKLQDKRVRDQQQMSQIAELAAAKREGRLESENDVASAMDSGIGAAPPQVRETDPDTPCPANPGPEYSCACTGEETPSWLSKAKGSAWKDGSYLLAVGYVEKAKDKGMAAGRAADRAASKIQAFKQGVKTDARGFPVKRIAGRLYNMENPSTYQDAAGTVYALGRLRTDGWKPRRPANGKPCPKMRRALYSCDCDSGRDPAWLLRGVWHEGDYLYSVGRSPATGKYTEDRATNRARAGLGRFLSGFALKAQPKKPSGGILSSRSVSDLQQGEIQFVAEQKLPGGGMAILLRTWVGE